MSVSGNNIPKLSYSSSKLILGCQQKYWHYKVNSTPRDSDAPLDTLAMDIGSALHGCLEECFHNLEGYTKTKFKVHLAKHNLDYEEHGPLIWAMLRKYKDLHEKVGLNCVAVETKLEDDRFLGFVDAVMEDGNSNLWLVDLKTAARVNEDLPSRLPMDRQLNLYIAKHPDRFKGARYRVVTKSRLKRRKSESFSDFSERIYGNIHAYDFEIPVEAMKPTQALEEFNQILDVQEKLFKGSTPVKNFDNCFAYFRPCEFWSQCHGANYTEEAKVVEVAM